MEIITYVKPLKDRKIEILFNDGLCAEIDIQPFIKAHGISQLLEDETVFKSVKIDEAGGIIWSNGFDFCPVFLRQMVTVKKNA